MIWTDTLYALQGLRESAPQIVNDIISAFSSEIVYLGIPMAIAVWFFWCSDKRSGMLMSFCTIFSSVVAVALKGVLCVPRPWQIDERIIPDPSSMKGAGGLSCPSGHAAAATAAYGSAVLAIGGRKILVIAALMVAAVCFSRMYLGVHTFLDVTLSVVIGAAVIASVWSVQRWMERGDGRDTVVFIVSMVFFAVMFASVYLLPSGFSDGSFYVDTEMNITSICKRAGLSFGILIGWFAERRLVGFVPGGSARSNVKRYLVGAIATCIIFAVPTVLFAYLGLSDAGYAVGGFLAALFAYLLYPWIMKRRASIVGDVVAA